MEKLNLFPSKTKNFSKKQLNWKFVVFSTIFFKEINSSKSLETISKSSLKLKDAEQHPVYPMPNVIKKKHDRENSLTSVLTNRQYELEYFDPIEYPYDASLTELPESQFVGTRVMLHHPYNFQHEYVFPDLKIEDQQSKWNNFHLHQTKIRTMEPENKKRENIKIKPVIIPRPKYHNPIPLGCLFTIPIFHPLWQRTHLGCLWSIKGTPNLI